MADTYVVTGAMMTCTFGMAPSSLVVLPSRTEMLGNLQRANIMDFSPMVNIMPFGMCNTLSNPTVAAATAAAMGALTPMPCIPAVTTPWMPGKPTMFIQGQPALTRSCFNTCMWGGQITFTTDGQMPGIPPIIVPPTIVPMPDLQPDWMLLNPEDAANYKHDFENAQHAGDRDRSVADHLQEMANRYAAQGDLEKAALAMQASEQYRNRADQKQAAAMEAVNNKYVWGGPEKEQTADMSKEDLQGIHDQAVQDQAQYDNEVNNIDKKLAKTKNEEKREELLAQREEAVANRDAAKEKADTAQQAIEAKETLEQHDAAVNNHKETLQSSHDKRDEVDALKREEQINRDEADAWYHVGVWSKEHESQESADRVFEKSNEYDQKANEAHQQWVAKEQEYKAELSQSREQAYGDDAMLDTYTADLKYDNAINNLNNPKK